ncbi:growth-regulating factor 8-like [Primulina eburnea]|uniref:growth-regulating factor 8-like n=1 Tax=Primulina eburnea TaxID=1245227 RepID=UPI003C6C823F
MKNRNEMKSTSTEYSDFGLALKIQAESPEFEKTRAFPLNQYQFTPSGAGGGRGGGPFFWDISSVQACGTDEFYAAGTAGGGGMAASENSLFTASQLHELERQQIIQKYMMASIPVPHELMLPFSRTSSCLAGAPQSKMCLASGSGVDSRFSSSKLDPEPWRCRRTDGKKWRCARNTAAEQRYCERHSHKNKPRSRKHVEAKCSTPSLQAPSTSQFPVMAPGVGTIPYEQSRRMRGGSSGTAIPVSTCSYGQQMHQIASRLDLMNRDHTHHQKNVSQSQALNKQDFTAPVANRFEFSRGEYCNSLVPSKMTSFQENLSLNSNRPHTTPPHFIDAWEQEGIKGLSPSSLTLSMSWNRNDEVNENDRDFGVGINESEIPGGPLGEALCLGNASNSSFRSPSDYNYTSNSGEDGSHASKFIR